MKLKTENLMAISNTLSGKSKDFADAIVEALNSAEESEVEVSIEDLKAQIEELSNKFVASEEEVADKIANIKKEILNSIKPEKKQNSMNSNAKEIAKAILNSNNKDEAMRKINAITPVGSLDDQPLGPAAIKTVAGKELNEIYDGFYKTNRGRWYYGDISDWSVRANIAGEYAPTVTNGKFVEKQVQQLTVDGKFVNTNYVYKRQQIYQADIDDAEQFGYETELVNDVKSELIANTKEAIIRAILFGDGTHRISTIEPIAGDTTDVFRTVVSYAAGQDAATVIRGLAEAVDGDKKWLFISPALKLQLSSKVYAAGGSAFFLTDDELAAQLGVDKVFTRDYGFVAPGQTGVNAIVVNPDEYWVREKKVLDLVYPTYENNALNLQYEINVGGALHGVNSAGIWRKNA